MIVTAKVRIECYLSKQKLTIQFISAMRDALPLKSLASYLPISPKRRSNVVLFSIHSRLAWGLREGENMTCGQGGKKNKVCSRNLHSQNAHHEYLKHTDKYWTSSPAPLCKKHLPPKLLLQSWWEATPNCCTWQETWRQSFAAQMGLLLFPCSCGLCSHFATGRHAISLTFVCARRKSV